jgi:hypothetical protein
MGYHLMSKLRIGYSPLSQDLNSAGDRRRLVFWAKNRGHTLITNLKQKVDVIVASENSDFNSSVFTESTAPIIFDLVDAYLSPLNPIDDLARGIGKKIRGVNEISPIFSALTKTFDLKLDFVTDEEYFMYLNRYIRRSTLSLLKSDLHEISSLVNIVPWTRENLLVSARMSSIAMIPINLSIPIQKLKPENRLLIMWRLGLPCLTSPSPAYVRVSSCAGVNAVSYSTQEWLENFIRILSDPDYARSQVTLGQNYLLENHTSAILLEKWDRAFESVLG